MIYERISINPKIMFGKPAIKGTRITVEQILRKLAGGMSVKEIMGINPTLCRMISTRPLPLQQTTGLKKIWCWPTGNGQRLLANVRCDQV